MKTISDNLKHIETGRIAFDAENPRQQNELQIKSQPSFKNLVVSVKEDGIIMPLIVKSMGKDFMLIDGERRLRAAIEANLEKVPVLIAENHVDGKILAYKAHKLHEKWSTVAEIVSIKHIVDGLRKQDPDVTDTVLRNKIKEITHEKSGVASDMLEIIKFNDKYIEKALSEELGHSYLIHIGKSFINKLKKDYPNILINYPENELRSLLAEKALKGLLGKTRFLMDTFKHVFNDKINKPEIEKILLKFLNVRNRDIISAYDEYNEFIKKTTAKTEVSSSDGQQKKTSKSKSTQATTTASTTTPAATTTNSHTGTNETTTTPTTLNSSTSQLRQNISSDHKKIHLTQKQQTNIKDVRKSYEDIAKTFSKDEQEYVMEAVHCLEEQCFKGAVLMIWATGISRILAYVEKNIPDFNIKSKEMATQKTSFYKHFAPQFRVDFKIIDEIRQNSKDMQLLCYICYKTFISEPNFKKMRAHLDKRNDCAHPTEIELGVNETIAIFEDVLNVILKNNKIA